MKIRNNVLAAASISAAMLSVSPAAAEPWQACGTVDAYPGAHWSAPDPAASGWDLDKLAAAKRVFESLESEAAFIVHRGRPIAAWGPVDQKLTAQSVRKALLNSLIGRLVQEGRLDVADTLEDLGIDDTAPPLSDAERQATLRDLMHSRSGIYHEALYEVGGWVGERLALLQEELRAQSDLYGPGDYWIYNNWDFNVLGTIVEQASGEEIGSMFGREIAGPLGMEDFAPEDVEYTTKDSITERYFRNWSEHRAYVFNISTRDLARYGVLWLACGEWNGERVLARDWVLESVDGVDTKLGRPEGREFTGFGDWGYLWQVERPGSRRYSELKTAEPVYQGTGARGHIVMVLPYLDLVIAHQVATVGGVSFEAQSRRARFGSPEITDEETEQLFAAIIEAHPEAGRAWGER